MSTMEELQKRIEQLEAENALVDEMLDGIVAVNSDLQVIRYNKCFAKMWDLPLFDPQSPDSLENLKKKMLEHLDDRDSDVADLEEKLLSFNQTLADFAEFPLKNDQFVEQIYNRENDSAKLGSYIWGFRDITRQRAARSKFYRNQQFLQRVIDNAPLILFSIDMNGTIEFLEGKRPEIFGFDYPEPVGRNIFERSSSVTNDELHKALQGEFIQINDVYNPNHKVHKNVTYAPLFDEDQEQIGVIGIIQDVTQMHDAKQKSKQQEHLLNRIIYNAPVLLIATNTEGDISFSRGKLLNRYNMRQAQDEGKNFFEVYDNHPIANDVRLAIEGNIVRNRHDFTMYGDEGKGGYSEVTCAPLRDDNGEIVGMVAVAVDVTDQTLAQLEIQRQSQYLDRILTNAPVMMFATDKDGVVTFSRGAELRHLGLDQNELVGRIIFPEDEFHPIQEDIERALNGETLRRMHQLGEIYVDIYYTPLVDQDRNNIGMIGVGVNITDIKRAEEAIEQSEELRKAKEAAEAANIAKTTFISNMSHELRTPLNSIIGFSQFLVNDRTLSPEHQEYMSLITRSSQHLLSLINDILEMSKIESGKIDLHEVNFDLFELLKGLDSIYHTKASEKELSFEIQIVDAMPRYLKGDRNKLRQILINLLSNAVKYTNDGGIVLRTWLDEPEFPDQRNKYHIHFEVEDTGVGIAEDEIDLLFDPFTQTSAGQQSAVGSGLGLVITKQFAQLLEGGIKVTSEEGKGTKFEVDIYMENATVIPEPEFFNKRRVIGIEGDREYKLLIVDDKWENRLMLLRTLENVGFKVREASNGREAIDIWQDWSPDLIWMDMRMPNMNGYDATRNIRQLDEGNGVVIIALTASAFEHERSEVLKAGCDDYMSKPFRQDELFQKMEHHLDITFIYEDRITSEFDALEQTELSLGMAIDSLANDLKDKLKLAATNYSLSNVLVVAEEIGQQDQALADRIIQLARDFDFGKIIEVLD